MKEITINNFIKIFSNESNHITQPQDTLAINETVLLIDENHTNWGAIATIKEKRTIKRKTGSTKEIKYEYKVKISTFIF